MKKTFPVLFSLLVAVFLVLAAASEAPAAYKIYLRNGSVISGVGAYVKSGGEVRFSYGGGVAAVPENDVLRIEQYGGPAEAAGDAEAPAPAAEAEPAAPSEGQGEAQPQGPSEADRARADRLRQEVERINGRLAEIGEKEDELARTKQEYDRIRLRIEILFQQGRKGAIAAGKSEAQWFQFLPAKERQWAQMNSIKKNELEAKIKSLEEELAPMADEKQRLMEERGRLEGELRGLKG
ncbi:MAG: hypothetical protein Kow0025_24460 [Thermodesulfovibrionales bacterium]